MRSAETADRLRSTLTIAGAIVGVCDWLTENVCSQIELKRPPTIDEPDGEKYRHELVHPVALPLFLPPLDRLPDGKDINIPSVCVGLVAGTDHANEKVRTLDISLSFTVWDPGEHPDDWIDSGKKPPYKDSMNGWMALWNFIDLTAYKLFSTAYIGGMEVVRNEETRFGPYRQASMDSRYAKDPDDYYPFYFGFYRFGLRCPFLPYNEDIEKLLK